MINKTLTINAAFASDRKLHLLRRRIPLDDKDEDDSEGLQDHTDEAAEDDGSDEEWKALTVSSFTKEDPKDSDINSLRTVPTIVIAHTFCASRDTRISYR